MPPLTEDVADEITWPTETGCASTVPAIGARTVASASLCRAMSRSVRAFTSCDWAFARSNVAASCSSAVMTWLAKRSSERLLWAVEIVTLVSAAWSAAAA